MNKSFLKILLNRIVSITLILFGLLNIVTANACPTIVTSNADSGTGSLREAVANTCVDDVITFVPGLTGPIELTGGQIIISKNLTINGPGAENLIVRNAMA
ncbi:MAG: hypothetical protein WCE43_04955, partial [Burkholderiales bacterium]